MYVLFYFYVECGFYIFEFDLFIIFSISLIPDKIFCLNVCVWKMKNTYRYFGICIQIQVKHPKCVHLNPDRSSISNISKIHKTIQIEFTNIVKPIENNLLVHKLLSKYKWILNKIKSVLPTNKWIYKIS